jgi:uncharacterized membrane protein YdjX (TVP38/TMEM64 family)
VSNGNKRIIKPLIFLFVLATLLVFARVFGLGHRLAELRSFIQGLGAWGPVLFVFIYAVAAAALIPGSALTVLASAMFGSAVGVATVSIAATLGASLAFFIARYVARGSVEQWLGQKAAFRRIDALTEKQGAIIVAITRLVPLFPFTLLNYAFGLTSIRFSTYVFWSWLCMLPGTVLYVVGTDAVVKLVAGKGIPWLLIGIFIFFIILVTFLVRRARSYLKESK